MKVPSLGRAIDERFLNHRLRSTSIAGIAGAWLALGLFAYRYYVNHVVIWELLAVGVTVAVVKMALMAWFLTTD